MAVTIYDIAKKVDISPASVSLGLRGNGRLSQKTRLRIKKAADELGYTPNSLARGLVGGKTQIIAFVTNYSSDNISIDTFNMERFSTIARTVATHNYRLFLHSSIYPQSIKKIIRETKSYGVDGLILYTNLETEEDRASLEENDFPTVILGRSFHSKSTSCLVYDNKSGAKQAVRHFLVLEHKKIAFVGTISNKEEAVDERLEGYKETLSEAGIEIDPRFILDVGFGMDAGKLAGLKLASFSDRPTAVLAATDQIAIGVIDGLREQGIAVPEDVSVIGFDNLHMCDFITPKLTSVDMSHGITANMATESLIKLINGETRGEKKIIPVNLIVRSSTMCCREKSAALAG